MEINDKSFLTYYLQSLRERTRAEKKQIQLGFDWVVYNIGVAMGYTAVRLPFFRSGDDQISKTKQEAEFGIDLSFLSEDKKELTIFALKDESLTNSNWKRHDFDSDLRDASTPDLSDSLLKDVDRVKVVLAYNKDEDNNGIKHFDNLTKSLGSKIGENVSLSFERWNLTRLVEETEKHILNPSLLPQKFFGQFTYICSQYSDFEHGSDQWEKQLMPNWRRFIDDVFESQSDERSFFLVPVSLHILRSYKDEPEGGSTGWLDLCEWAMIRLMESARASGNMERIALGVSIWEHVYIKSLHEYYSHNAEALGVLHSLELARKGGFGAVGAIQVAGIAQWHLARIGLLSLAFSELHPPKDDDQVKRFQATMRRYGGWIAALLNANDGAYRPYLDLHHIQLVLVWAAFYQAGKMDDLYGWLHTLILRLTARRFGYTCLPFIEAYNSTELVFEAVSTGETPTSFCEKTSVLLLVMMELACCLPDETKRQELLNDIYERLVHGRDSGGNEITEDSRIDLVSWVPPEDWQECVLSSSMARKGTSLFWDGHIDESFNEAQMNEAKIESSLRDFVAKSEEAYPTALPDTMPMSAMVLACLKHKSPLPPRFWRSTIFPKEESE